MLTKVLLDPSFRLIDTIFTDEDLQRIHAGRRRGVGQRRADTARTG